MFAVIGSERVDEELAAAQLGNVTATVREQPGFVRGYWGQEAEDHTYAHAFVVLEDEAGARAMAAGSAPPYHPRTCGLCGCSRTRRADPDAPPS